MKSLMKFPGYNNENPSRYPNEICTYLNKIDGHWNEMSQYLCLQLIKKSLSI